MSLIQRLILSLVPKSWGEAMEAESRLWMIRCRCGHEVSYWDVGGIRYKAVSRGKYLFRHCSQCGKWSWHQVYKRPAAQPATAGG